LARKTKNEAKKGSRVNAKAGMIGYGNMRLTIIIETICPKIIIIAKNRKEVK
jgi:hypothetical protein